MIRPICRVLFLVACAALLAYGMRLEWHEVYPLSKNREKPGPQSISGPGFVEAATVDSYMLRNGHLYDVYTLSDAPVQEKDCKT